MRAYYFLTVHKPLLFCQTSIFDLAQEKRLRVCQWVGSAFSFNLKILLVKSNQKKLQNSYENMVAGLFLIFEELQGAKID